MERDFFLRGLAPEPTRGSASTAAAGCRCRQCELLGVSRSSQYYAPSGESAELLRRLDELHLEHPFYGSRQIGICAARAWSPGGTGCGG